ncbi:OmpP1/FadL family transporter [Pedobacter cryophilus]|uniref:Hemin receptor n=1 Tax=Pedobacter cryophilus TaxID=2571271 RepID=A0A4U1BZK8_9SPHI|nr:outer membrane protein transport protein [Pedobacter cryophilus]TKB96017.1 hypothetical protein FA046_15225 [Pedobacter cryophilus]
MNLKKTLLVVITVIATQTTYAQYLADALRFSQFQNSSTARMDAIGGYKSAIGGDLSSLYGNPAGLGMFSKSEFSFTPSLKLRNNDITFNSKNTSGSSSNVDLNNAGVVFHAKTYKKGDLNKGLLSLNFGIGYQKKSAFRNDFMYAGTTNLNGLGDYFAETASSENATQSNLTSAVNGAAYDSFLIEATSANPTRYVPNTSTNSEQIQSVDRTGGSSSIDFTLGANVSNTVFLGASLGLSSFKFTSTEMTNEVGLYAFNGNNFDYDVNYNRNFNTDGSGINLKLGMILKPVSTLRIGLAFESPTWYTVTDNYSEELNNPLDNINGTDDYPFEYQLRTPTKLNGGISYFFGDKGFISADLGFVDYSSIQFTSSDSRTDLNTNTDIKQTYKNAINYSVGGEYRIQPNLLLRVGYQLTGNPYKNLNNKDFEISAYSGGFGYRFGAYYLDMSIINSNNKLFYSNYSLSDSSEPVSTIETRNNSVALTFGVRF